MELSGVINVYKEKGFTSQDVVAVVRKTLGYIKAGHTGTLDPDAEGVLPICIGKATKLSDYLMAGTKAYRATLRLGITTDTQDASGEVLEQQPVTSSREQIESAVRSFTGKYEQVPPMYSAVKVNGKKLYELARAGKTVERKARSIEIFEITPKEFLSDTELIFDVTCSKGTYIRSLCADIGQKLGCGGYMSALVRTRTGGFSLDSAIRLSELKAQAAESDFGFIMPIRDVLADYRTFTADNSAGKYLQNGNKLSAGLIEGADSIEDGETVLILDSAANPAGLYIFDNAEHILRPVTMLYTTTTYSRG